MNRDKALTNQEVSYILDILTGFEGSKEDFEDLNKEEIKSSIIKKMQISKYFPINSKYFILVKNNLDSGEVKEAIEELEDYKKYLEGGLLNL